MRVFTLFIFQIPWSLIIRFILLLAVFFLCLFRVFYINSSCQVEVHIISYLKKNFKATIVLLDCQLENKLKVKIVKIAYQPITHMIQICRFLAKILKNFALKWLTQGLMTKRGRKTAIEYLVSNLLSINKSYTAGYWLARTQVVK